MEQSTINQTIFFVVLFLLSAGVCATLYCIWQFGKNVKPVDIWPIFLLALFIVGIIGVAVTGDVRWLGLSVLPGIVFWRWMRI